MIRRLTILLAVPMLLLFNSNGVAEAKTYSHASATSKAHHCKANKGWNSKPLVDVKAHCEYVSAPKGYVLIKAGQSVWVDRTGMARAEESRYIPWIWPAGKVWTANHCPAGHSAASGPCWKSVK